MTHPIFVAPILLNIILLVVSLCVTDSELLNSVCINRSVWTPTLSLLSSTDKDLLYHDMSACPHNSTVYGRDSVCDRQRDPLSNTTPTHTITSTTPPSSASACINRLQSTNCFALKMLLP